MQKAGKLQVCLYVGSAGSFLDYFHQLKGKCQVEKLSL